MTGKRTILIAEDNRVNRRILKKILSPEYDLLMAENGREALDLLEQQGGRVSALILDLGMPVMDGFAVLRALREQGRWSKLPVLVATGSADSANETRALAMGAWDFVTKPYNAEIIQFRLRNAIDRSQLDFLRQIRYQAEHDPLTGFYNAAKFFQEVRLLLDANPQEPFAMVRLNISRFRQFSELYGSEAGDAFISYIASRMPDFAGLYKKCIYARIEADVFAVCVAYGTRDALYDTIRAAQRMMKDYSRHFEIVTIYGIYFIEDRSLSPAEMLDCAAMASKTVQNRYQDSAVEYTREMGQRKRQEQELAQEMGAALEQEQFCVYYQPKYNTATETPCGAEALVRWKHPQKGLIPPGAFIPVFERVGFIAKVDYYVWERTCRDLKRWCDAGYAPDPVSVNVSRVNLNNPQIVEIITALVQKYGIEPALLQLEITETAYMDNPELMTRVVDRFHEKGFTILMDDFGSGYSSLNTLKDIPVDILKIDMKFLPTDNSSKGEKILTSVVRMANWLGMPVITEGVETKAQKDFLHSIGCLYVQGYYYARPMPGSEYESLIQKRQLPRAFQAAQAADGSWELDALLSADPRTEAVLDSISVPVGIYECGTGHYDRVRVNHCFYDTFGYQKADGGPHALLPEEEQSKLKQAFDRTITRRTNTESEILFLLPGAAARWYRVSFRYMMPMQNTHLVCAVFVDISQERKARSEMERIEGILNQYGAEKQSLLVVDDSEVNRVVVQQLFRDEFRVLQASDGQEGLDLLKVHKDEIAIILLDMRMPKMDGSEFLAAKNHLDGAVEIPVVVISADQREESQLNMLRSGVNDYVTKPFVPETLSRRVRNVLEYQSRFTRIIAEYRKVLSLSPEVSRSLNKSYLSLAETRALVQLLTPVFDVVRLVDPADTAIITIDAEDQICRSPYSCFRVWSKNTRCENCTSAQACQSGCPTSKYEFMGEDIFYVVSRPIEIFGGDGSSISVILEIVSQITSSYTEQKLNGVPMRKMLENTRRKIYCDPLTAAYNRRYLYEMLFLHHGRTDTAREIAVIMLDMDGFKHINDTCGHAEGDRVLMEVTQAIQDGIRASDSLVRYGGDEFLVILSDYPEEQVPQKIEALARAVGKVTYGENGCQRASARFGYAHTAEFRADRAFLDELIRRADADMYRAKRALYTGEEGSCPAH